MSGWTNWTGDQSCAPAVVEHPSSVEEVSAAVQRAAEARRTVRVAGAGHSFGDLVCTSGSLISLDRLTGVLDVDAEAGLVRVAAGTRLHELNRLLDAHGLALPNLGDIDRQSVAGAISTATHGTGRLLGNLATQVEAVELVLADSGVLECTAANAEVLQAARVSLGALGVITACTLRVVPAFNLRAEVLVRPLAEAVARLDELVDGNDHFEFFAFPHSPLVLSKMNNRTDEPAAGARSWAQRHLSSAVENQVHDLLCRLGRRAPAQIPRLNRALTRLMSSSVRVDTSVGSFVSTRTVRFTEMEWALPRAACAGALADILAVIDRRGFAVNFPIEVRFVAGDEAAFLSPAYGRETAYLAVHMYRGMPWRPYFEAVQDIALSHGGRPHWGKRHLLDAAALAARYPAWDRFQAVRAELDPGGRFANDHIRHVLGPI
ncbi:MAG: D-arabinono-1,4-lactone oxidase [Pseudonocardiales bacterium]